MQRGPKAVKYVEYDGTSALQKHLIGTPGMT